MMYKLLASSLLCAAAFAGIAEVIPLDKNLAVKENIPARSFLVGKSDKGTVLTFVLNKKGTVTVSAPLNPVQMAGKEIVFSVWAKLDGISEPANAWNGVKVMAAYTDANGKSQYPQVAFASDTTPWNRFYLTVKFPEKLKSARLVLGLEEVSGTVQFRDLQWTEKNK